MFSSLIKPYRGLSKEVWLLSLATLINRAGAMVIPFLSLYLSQHLGYSLEQVGWVMSCYGLGSVVGVYIGGKLSDDIGYLKVLYGSLFMSGLAFMVLQMISSFYLLCLGIFILTLLADTFRPAVWVALDDYSNPENRTRSVTLVRLAINLGFSMGPAMGGLIIASIGYFGLFWVDGLTCITASAICFFSLPRKGPKVEKTEESDQKQKISPYADKPYWIFWIAMFLIGFTFMQYFATVPLYYSEILDLGEEHIGLILASNGLMIFLLEMPLVHGLERSKLEDLKILIGGTFLLALSFWVLNLGPYIVFALIGIVLMTFGEMLGFPFSNSWALDRSKRGNQGAYMAMYSMSFSVAHIIGPNVGMQISATWGYMITWVVMGAISFLACIILYYLWKKESGN